MRKLVVDVLGKLAPAYPLVVNRSSAVMIFLRDHAAAPAFLTEPRFLRQRGMRALIFALAFSMAFAPGG
jgi:hypothetical protein